MTVEPRDVTELRCGECCRWDRWRAARNPFESRRLSNCCGWWRSALKIIIIIDAMGTQRANTGQIIEQGEVFVLALKGNRGRCTTPLSDASTDSSKAILQGAVHGGTRRLKRGTAGRKPAAMRYSLAGRRRLGQPRAVARPGVDQHGDHGIETRPEGDDREAVLRDGKPGSECWREPGKGGAGFRINAWRLTRMSKNGRNPAIWSSSC